MINSDNFLRVINLNKSFDNKLKVCNNISFEINAGELLTLLGPSGCGKTTTLRCIAGLEIPDSGQIFIGKDKEITNLPASKRNIGMVFQNWALWPHMTVKENIMFGLHLRKIPKKDSERRVQEILKVVKLVGYEDRYPSTLSGGQKQRIALSRTLVVRPKILLLDEPLSSLDAKLRNETRMELLSIQKSLKITTLYVTHDQIEALSISDRIAIMNKGEIIQIGKPREIYYKPATKFASSFMGETNIIKGKVIDNSNSGNFIDVEIAGEIYKIPKELLPKEIKDEYICLSVHAEDIVIGNITGNNVITFIGKLEYEVFEGSRIKYMIALKNDKEKNITLNVITTSREEEEVMIGSIIKLSIELEKVVFFNISDDEDE